VSSASVFSPRLKAKGSEVVGLADVTSDDPSGLFEALAKVAARALVMRHAATQEWGVHQRAMEGWCAGHLDQALTEFEAAAPELHAELAEQTAALLAKFRADLGLPAADGA